MAPTVRHFMDESDIGSGEKTPAELEDLNDTSHLNEDINNRKQAGAPQDGRQLKEVVDEQEFIAEHENHIPEPLSEENERIRQNRMPSPPASPMVK